MLRGAIYLSWFICMLMLNEPVFGQSEKKIRIDPDQAYGGKTSDYFESVEYIPLETSSKSLFGEITKLVVTDSSFVVFDYDTQSVLFFSDHGKFITRVAGSKNGYISIMHDFAKKNIKMELYNYATSKKVVAHYSYKGKLLNSKKLAVSAGNVSLPGISIEKGATAIFNNAYFLGNKPPADTVTHLIEIYQNQKLSRTFFPVSQKQDLGFCSIAGAIEPPKLVENGAFYISTPLNHRVYRISKSDTQFLFQFVFPVKRTLSKEIFNPDNKKYIDSVSRNIADDQKTIIDVSNIFFRKSKLYFKLNMRRYTSYFGSESKYLYNFIYDTASAKFVALERIIPDEKSFFLPLFDNRINLNGLEYNSDHFYASVSSLKMFQTYNATSSKNTKYTGVLEEYFKIQNRKSNPVIVKMKLKE